MHPLDSCRLRISRANDHAQELGQEVLAWANRNPYGTTGEFDADASEYVFRYRVFEPPPARWAVLVGDVVHNLASCLEHLAWQLVIRNGETPIEGQTGFPVFETRPRWDGRAGDGRGGGKWMMEGMSDLHQATIELFQPYRDPKPSEHPLAQLRQLWNIDKHRAPTPVLGRYLGSGSQITVVAVHDIEAGSVTYPDRYPIGPVEDRADFIRVGCKPSGPNPTMHMKGNLSLGVVFGEGVGPAGEEVGETLYSIYLYVEGLFQEFTRSFP